MNYLAILAAGAAAWFLGALYYGPIFGKKWQQEVGLSDETLKNGNMPLIFGSSFVLMCLMMYGLSFAIGAHPEITWSHGFFHGAMTGIMFAAASMGINYLYQRRSLTLWLIDSTYQVLFLGIGGAIMALMGV